MSAIWVKPTCPFAVQMSAFDPKRRTLWAALSRIPLRRVACLLLGAERTSGGNGTMWDRARMALSNQSGLRAVCRVLLPALLHSTIAPAARPTGIARWGAPIALKKEPEAVVVPEVVARNEGLGRRLARYEATLGLIAQHCDKLGAIVSLGA